MSLNRAMIIGYLGQGPEIRYTPRGMPVVNFSVATDEVYLDKEGNCQSRTQWHRIVAIGKLALVCHENLRKGLQVFVEGRLHTSNWSDNRALSPSVEIVATSVEFLGASDQSVSESGENENEPNR